jgi:hypothetical protein
MNISNTLLCSIVWCSLPLPSMLWIAILVSQEMLISPGTTRKMRTCLVCVYGEVMVTTAQCFTFAALEHDERGALYITHVIRDNNYHVYI